MKQKKLFSIQTANQTNCKQPGLLTCVICNLPYMAGEPPSIFVYYDTSGICSPCSTSNGHHSHCDWVCSAICAELWVIENK